MSKKLNRRNNLKRISNFKNTRNFKPIDEATLKPIRRKKLSITLFVTFLLLFLLVFRLFYIEIVSGAEYKEAAYKQQTINRIISPQRGTIYDSTGKALAMSSRVDTVTINPRENSLL